MTPEERGRGRGTEPAKRPARTPRRPTRTNSPPRSAPPRSPASWRARVAYHRRSHDVAGGRSDHDIGSRDGVSRREYLRSDDGLQYPDLTLLWASRAVGAGLSASPMVVRYGDVRHGAHPRHSWRLRLSMDVHRADRLRRTCDLRGVLPEYAV